MILIQVVKEERGNKGAAVTTRLSLAGKYCVLMPNTNKGGGISRKVEDLKQRKKLKDILHKLNIKKGMGVIIRTAGQIMGIKEIKRDYTSLIKLWSEITSKTIKSNAPCLIHEEDNLIKRCLRDYFDSTYNEILINDKNILKKSKEIIKQFMPRFS
ncbi:MAG: ribonuclease E/G [Alphaproteobacteria bacterium]